MQASFVCFSCRSRSLVRLYRREFTQRRHFVSFNSTESAPQDVPTRKDIIPEKQKEDRLKQPIARSANRNGRRSNDVDKSIEAVLIDLFDANRHRAPSSKTTRYSRKPIASHPGHVDLQSSARDDVVRSTVVTERSNSHNKVPHGYDGSEPNLDPGISHSNLFPPTERPRSAHKLDIGQRNGSSRLFGVKRKVAQDLARRSPQSNSQHSSNVGSSTARRSDPLMQQPINISISTGFSLEEQIFVDQLDRVNHIAGRKSYEISNILEELRKLALPSKNTRLREKLHDTVKVIANRILEDCSRLPGLLTVNAGLPEVLDWYQKYQLVLPTWYLEFLTLYINQFYQEILKFEADRQPQISSQFPEVMDGVLFLWKHYFALVSSPSRYSESSQRLDWKGVPEVEKIITERGKISQSFQERVHHFFPGVPMKDVSRITSLIGATCLGIHHAALNQVLHLPLQRESERFLFSFHHMMRGAQCDVAEMQRFWTWGSEQRLLNMWKDYELYVRDNIPYLEHDTPIQAQESVKQEKFRVGTESIQHNSSLTSKQKSGTKTYNSETAAFKKTASTGDVKRSNELWQKFKRQLQTNPAKPDNLSAIFADFLQSFVSLRRVEPINEVWTAMTEQGVRPNIHHWNPVLEVLQKNREREKFQAMWNEMIDSGCKPDNQSWTNYIVTALASRDSALALRIIENMGEAWSKSLSEIVSDQTPDTEQAQYLPSVVPINAAITGLLRLDLLKVARDVLQWAQDFSVSIDAATYNIFLRYACRRSDNAEVESILKDMEEKHVPHDIVTKTIILDNQLRNPKSDLHIMSSQEQEEMVLAELKKMLQDGHKPNAQTYAVVLYSLLHVTQPNLPAANAVFRLLVENVREVPPHIYTILFTHYFESDEPDLEAIDSLWNRLEKQKTRIDHVLYDRMIEGYASIGQIQRMITYFRKMTDAGQVPGWLALERALAALVKHRRWDLCAEFVADAVSEGGHLHLGKRGWRGKKEFWQLVRELEEEKLIPKFEKPGF